MKTACSGLLAFFLCYVSEAQFHDSFSDGDFHANPQWTGDTAYFFVNSDSTLQSNGPASSGEIFLFTPWNKLKNTIWEFEAILDFPTSTSNYAMVYLAADSDSLSSDLNGYYVRLGGASGSTDAIDLYRQDGDKKEKIISGIEGFFGADSNHVQLRVIRDFYGHWSLYADSSMTGNFILQGTAFDSAHTETLGLGIVCRHTSSRSDLFYFDNFSIRNGELNLLEVLVPNDSNLVLQFSSTLDTTAIDPSKISLNNTQVPVLEAIADQDQMKIRLGDKLEAGIHSIVVTQIIDDQQNILPMDSLNFHYLPPPKKGEIVINEIMADPEPQIGLPVTEYVEIFNASDSEFNLSDVEYSDSGNPVALPDQIIAPKEIIILCKAEDTADFRFFGHCIGLDVWPTLNNGGDILTLRTKSGTLVDQVKYNQDWYQDENKSQGGWSLERINPFKKCSDRQNWTASIEGSGGTPGIQNSVYDDQPDTQSPTIEFTEVISDYQLEIHFDEILDSLNSNTSVETIPMLDLQWLHTGSESVKISFVKPFDSGMVHQIIIDSLSDCEGNTAFELVDHFGLGKRPETFDLIITEIMADPEPSVGLPETEYFEILNKNEALISLRDVILINHKDSFELPGVTMSPGSYLTFCPASGLELLSIKSQVLKLSPWPGLNNGGDHLKIDYFGNVIFEIDYDQDWLDDSAKESGGWSLEIIDPDNPCGENDNWTASLDPSGGTPGRRNSVWANNPDLQGPWIKECLLVDSNYIQLQLNEKADLSLMNTNHFTTKGNFSVFVFENQERFSKKIDLKTSQALIPKIKYSMEIEYLADCISNFSFDHEVRFVLPEMPDSGDLRINEILADPYSGGSEFVEIANISNKIINLQNLRLKTVDSQNREKSMAILTPEAINLHPDEFLVLSQDTSAIKAFYPHSDPSAFFEVGGFPSLTNQEGYLLLLDSSGRMLDSVFYAEKLHFELIHDTKGVSLERISLNKAGWQEDNWTSASETIGYGTPGLPNSKRYSPLESNKLIEITPPLFSPDGDGYNDLVNIAFNSNDPGIMLTLEIYNVSGQLVKQLANNVNTGFANSFFCDGIDHTGKKCPMGNYILLAEYFNANGEFYKARKVISLGGRL